MYYHDLNKIRIIMLVYLKAIIKQGVGLPKTRRIFFTRKNYPQSIDTDTKQYILYEKSFEF